MATKIEPRYLPKRFKEEPPKKGLPTLKTKNCFVCGTNQCYNGTLVEYEGSKHLVRVCNKESCKASIHTNEGLAAIKAKNLLTPSIHKPSLSVQKKQVREIK